jgi:hypothetical protein
VLIHVDRLTSRFAPLKVHHFDEATGSLLIGDGEARIMLTREEVEELSRILQSLSLTCSEVHKL